MRRAENLGSMNLTNSGSWPLKFEFGNRLENWNWVGFEFGS